MSLLCVYLLAGLLAHKALWEALKRRDRPAAKLPRSMSLLLVKAVKIGILLGILIQTALPLFVKFGLPLELFPISADPYRLRVFGVILYTMGLVTAILGRLQLGESWSDIEAPRAAEQRPVVSQGLYSYIRHPIYTGDLMLLVGLELSLNSWLVLGAVLLVPIVYFRAVKEEKLLAKELGGYDAYVKRTKRFIPFVV